MDLSVNVCLAGLSTTALGLHLYLKLPHSSTSSTSSSTSSSTPTSSLTWIYLPAHLLALFSDWLQGPYVFQVSHLNWGFHLPVQFCLHIAFQLYRHHGHSDGSIALLFLAGYVSSCFLGRYNNSSLAHLKTHRQLDVDLFVSLS